ncbi:S-layer homology domain-containing protein [Heliobacterium chlorum]|uniref:S-layer homology domain-containing protein n=1 Tax=Heliobacterium chlorum TaxID=2698 RepID=A0ABR7T970_HELCL|nr:PepSY domain-containing protein [Heliobacterium chlorum]MBC9786231.1 S-layer homology domain-containing protein [Heliobacterium chlorum]
MNRRSQRILSLCVSGCLLTTLLPSYAFAGETTLISQQTKVSLEQAIRIVKDNFPVPQDLDDFRSGFNEFNGRKVWNLSWNATKGSNGSFSAEVDGTTGEILSMNHWDWQPDPSNTALNIADITMEVAKETASQLVQRLNSGKWQKLQLVTDINQSPFVSKDGNRQYNFYWQRIENQIPFPGNGISVAVDSKTGKVVNYQVNWTTAALPDTKGVISPEKAKEGFIDANMLELQYFFPRRDKAESKPFLVYRLTNPSEGAIDAFTGQPLIPKEQWIQKGYGSFAAGMGMSVSAVPSKGMDHATELRPEELKEISQADKFISRDQAIESIKKWLQIPKDITLRNASLSREWDSQYGWNIFWDGSEGKNLSCRVNALTGELIGYYHWDQSMDDSKNGELNRDGARQLAETFLKKIQPKRFQGVQLDNQQVPPEPRPLIQNPMRQTFSYVRKVNGIPFPDNRINVTVNTLSKEVTEYNLDWTEKEFPSSSQVMSTASINENFLNKRPLTLTYAQADDSKGNQSVKLIYQPLSASRMAAYPVLLDARTGQSLDWEGNIVDENKYDFKFNDISGIPLEAEIHKLGQINLFREYGSAFHPNESVSMVSLLRGMVMIKSPLSDNKTITDQEVIASAKSFGWVQGEVQPGDAVTREQLAKLTVRMLKLEPAAKVQKIYQLPFEDAASLSDGSIGYVALAWGLGMIKTDTNNLAPQQAVTRAEAAYALLQAMKVK